MKGVVVNELSTLAETFEYFTDDKKRSPVAEEINARKKARRLRRFYPVLTLLTSFLCIFVYVYMCAQVRVYL